MADFVRQSALLAIGVRAVQISFPLASTSSGVMALLFLAGLRIAALLLLGASFRYTPEYTIKSLVLRLVHQLEVLLVALFHLCTQRLALLHFRTMLLNERVHVLLWFAQRCGIRLTHAHPMSLNSQCLHRSRAIIAASMQHVHISIVLVAHTSQTHVCVQLALNLETPTDSIIDQHVLTQYA